MSRAVLRPVTAAVTDDRDAVRTIRYAARLARAAQRPVLLLVTLPGTGPPSMRPCTRPPAPSPKAKPMPSSAE